MYMNIMIFSPWSCGSVFTWGVKDREIDSRKGVLYTYILKNSFDFIISCGIYL
jgi:hypothetical protein